MKKFLEEYGFAILATIVIICLITVSSPIGVEISKNVQNTIDKFATASDRKIDKLNETIILKSKDIIEIDGKKYIIVEPKGFEQYLVMSLDPVHNKRFNEFGWNGQTKDNCNTENMTGCYSIYENSSLNSFLENDYFNSLPRNFQLAIVPSQISQDISEPVWNNPNYKAVRDENNNFKGWYVLVNGEWVNTYNYEGIKGQPGAHLFKTENSNSYFKRKVYPLSISDFRKIVDIDDEYEVNKFFKEVVNNGFVLTRDKGESGHIITLDEDRNSLRMSWSFSNYFKVYPSFIIDLSMVKWNQINT